MRTHRGIRQSLPAAALVACLHFCSNTDAVGGGNTVRGLVYCNYLEQLTPEQLTRIRDCPDVEYVLNQMTLYPEIYGGDNALERDRIIELAEAGKRVVIQVWFGPGGPYNWSYCGYPNIAMQAEVRDYLFGAIDKAIEQIGPEHIYGMHLLEEDGHMGTEIDVPGDWRRNRGAVRSGEEDNNCYNNYSLLTKEYGPPSPWNPLVPNIAQYDRVFRDETGLDMHDLPADDPYAAGVLDRWMARRLWAGTHRAFAEHLREEHPGIRPFVWGDVAARWTGVSLDALRGTVRGVITDPYTGAFSRWHTYSSVQMLLPDAEHLVLLWGGADLDVKRERIATAWLGGASGIGFFEDEQGPGGGYVMDFQDDARWATNTALFEQVRSLPVQRRPKRTFVVVTGNIANGYSTSVTMLPPLNLPAIVHHREAANVRLDRYRAVILLSSPPVRHRVAENRYGMRGTGLDDQRLERWLRTGGVLFLIATRLPEGGDCFVTRQGLASTGQGWVLECQEPRAFAASSEAVRRYGLTDKYRMLIRTPELRLDSTLGADALPVGAAFRHGKGTVCILPVWYNFSVLHEMEGEEKAGEIEALRGYLGDVMRGVLRSHGLADGDVDDMLSLSPDEGFRWEAAHGGLRAQTVHDGAGHIWVGGHALWD